MNECAYRAYRRIRDSEASNETKALAKAFLPQALVELGDLSVFWDTEEGSIIFESDSGTLTIIA